MSVSQPSLFADPEYERREAQRMRGQKAIIKVAYINPSFAGGPPGFRERDAVVYGPLALMPVVIFDRYEGRSRNDGWNITHVATGFAVAPSIPSKAEALRIIYLLKDEEWSFRHAVDVPEYLKPKIQRLVEEAKNQ